METILTPVETEVLSVFDTFWQSYARRDLDARFAVCSPDITFIGTGLHERAIGMAQYRAMNQKGVEEYPHAFEIEMLWQDVRIHGEVAWVECDTRWIIGEGEAQTRDIVRLTTIFKRVQDRWLVAHVHGSDPDYRLREGEYMTQRKMQARNRELEREVAERTLEVRAAKKRSDDLLLNILPESVAEELKATGSAVAKQFDQATILFTDFKNFTGLSEVLSAHELVHELNTCFKAFDKIVTARGIEKIKTVGDAYMAASGLPAPSSSTAVDVVLAALEMQAFVRERKSQLIAQGKPAFEMRVGINSGPVVAGIVGDRKFQYDIWGDTVNTASRMESSGEADRVNISRSTYELVKNAVVPQLSGVQATAPRLPPDNEQLTTRPAFILTPRGKVQAKGKGELEMWFVELA